MFVVTYSNASLSIIHPDRKSWRWWECVRTMWPLPLPVQWQTLQLHHFLLSSSDSWQVLLMPSTGSDVNPYSWGSHWALFISRWAAAERATVTINQPEQTEWCFSLSGTSLIVTSSPVKASSFGGYFMHNFLFLCQYFLSSLPLIVFLCVLRFQRSGNHSIQSDLSSRVAQDFSFSSDKSNEITPKIYRNIFIFLVPKFPNTFLDMKFWDSVQLVHFQLIQLITIIT